MPTTKTKKSTNKKHTRQKTSTKKTNNKRTSKKNTIKKCHKLDLSVIAKLKSLLAQKKIPIVFHTMIVDVVKKDVILPSLGIDPTKLDVSLSKSGGYIWLHIGPRDFDFDSKTGAFVGSGTSIWQACKLGANLSLCNKNTRVQKLLR